jgi:hypothetical protein
MVVVHIVDTITMRKRRARARTKRKARVPRKTVRKRTVMERIHTAT